MYGQGRRSSVSVRQQVVRGIRGRRTVSWIELSKREYETLVGRDGMDQKVSAAAAAVTTGHSRMLGC